LKQSALFHGYVFSVAETHPLQTKLTFILTDFEPNSNRQSIPKSEAENIINTARNMPIKIAFDGTTEVGHNRATPIGPIIDTRLDTINGSEVIVADALLWKSEYPEIDEYLKTAQAENKKVGTSWELYYSKSRSEDGIEWLEGIVVAGTAIVKVPAYGDRTPILSIAERVNMEEKITELETALADLRSQFESAQKELEKAQSERDQLVAEKEAEAASKVKAELLSKRVAQLNEIGMTVDETDTDMISFLESAADDTFNLLARNWEYAKTKTVESPVAAKAEETVKVPATFGNRKPSADALAEALVKMFDNK